ncbi:MAG TPA: hypothetical protein VMS93_08715 [Candidatus Saccharimonadales bacterium]|nr:hypothetical protein [Candidatus Saccharimonadales bacterium]
MKTPNLRLPIPLALLLAAALLPRPALAQSCLEAQREITAADRTLQVVSPVVQGSGDATAADQLARAQLLEGQAKAAFTEGRCPLAARLAGRARELADKALVRVRRGAGDRNVRPDFARRELERTDEILARAAPRVKESGSDRAQIVLDGAAESQTRAWALVRDATAAGAPDQARLATALELTMKARDGARQAFDLATQNSGMNPDRLAEELRLTDGQIATAVEWSRAAGSSGSAARLEVARSMEERARRRFEQRDYPEALGLTQRARQLVRDVLSGAGQVDPAELDRAIQAARSALDRARSAGLPADGLRLLGQGELRYSRAVEQRDAGHPWVALLSARAARDLALRAMGGTP